MIFIKQESPSSDWKEGLGDKSLAMSYFRMAKCHTIIGAKWFHFRVRDGIGWFTLAMVTKQGGLAEDALQHTVSAVI